MKTIFIIILFTLGVGLLSFTSSSGVNTPGTVIHTLEYFRQRSTEFAEETANLKEEINKIDANDSLSIIRVKEALKKCRLEYKSIEFFLTYFLPGTSLIYNQPNKVEVEEPFLESHEPVGLQVIEAILFEKKVLSRKKELLEQADLISSSANDIHALLYKLNIDDKRILESIRLELIRTITLGITGFDTPELKTGIAESAQVFKSMKIILALFFSDNSKEEHSLKNSLNLAIKLLEESSDFDSFDRLDFLVKAALPLQDHLAVFIRNKGLQLNIKGASAYTKNLFNINALGTFIQNKTDTALVRLGQQLFFDKILSGNLTRSCATCHQPEKYFTDQLPKSPALDGISTVERNAPSLFYAAYQLSQFWDGRVKTLEEQINSVLINKKEMAADHKIVVKRLLGSRTYIESFKKAFQKADNAVTIPNVAMAISAFLKTLAPMNSPFDQYIAGKKNAITKQQINGFNLFMGKAQCGTCHFAPLFNGLVPPLYNRTEFEVLGVTKNTDFKKAVPDEDNGRYTSFPILSYKGAFKTPTVRNTSRTAPYMHNGAFETLEQVMDFYNKGGGVGVGLNIPAQTLSPKLLNLDKSEIEDIVSFLNSLTDSYSLPADSR
jgi:cytochrome c peroxidase